MPWDLLFLLLLEISEFTDCFAIPEGICFVLLIDYRTPWGLLFLLLLDILEFTDCFAIPEGICFF